MRIPALLLLPGLALGGVVAVAQEEGSSYWDLFHPEVLRLVETEYGESVMWRNSRPRPAGYAGYGFSFCRLEYTGTGITIVTSNGPDRGGGNSGWKTDYPYADVNLSMFLGEVTTAPVDVDQHGRPQHWTIRADSPELFKCPFVAVSDAGSVVNNPQRPEFFVGVDDVVRITSEATALRYGFTQPEVENLRNYLLKGGFLWVDDFWGTAAWLRWAGELDRIMPLSKYAVLDLIAPGGVRSMPIGVRIPLYDLPLDHPIFKVHFWEDEYDLTQIVDLDTYKAGKRWEVPGWDGAEVHVRAVVDPENPERILMLMTHNIDVLNGVERELDDEKAPGYREMSTQGYNLGVNFLLYAMAY